MSVSPIAAVFTLLGGLLLAGILGWIRQARLIVLVPRLFTHSNLTSRGQLVEISVFNRGFKTEESIELLLNPTLKYELVGANSPDSSLNNGKLNIPRVGADDEVTALLLVEGGTFTRSDIVSCLSKDSKGKLVTKLEEVPPTGPQRIGLVAFFVVAPLAFYGMTFGVDYFFLNKNEEVSSSNLEAEASESSSISLTNNDSKEPIELNGWVTPYFYRSSSARLYKDIVDQKIVLSLLPISRKADIVTIPLVVVNQSEAPIIYDLSVIASGSQDKIPYSDRRASDLIVMPQSRLESQVRAIIPVNAATQSEKTIYIECFLKSTDGDTIKLSRLVILDNL